MQTNNIKPCLAQTPQGFTVSYNQRFLYSKYNPQKAIISSIEALELLPGTAIICCSPVLNYGVTELANKLPESCHMFICEADKELWQFSQEQYDISIVNCSRLSPEELYTLPQLLQTGTFKRAIRIDFSAGVQFHSAFYDSLIEACVSSIKTFWVNRVTLTKFGRCYSKNFFTNLKHLSETTPIENYLGSVSKPIIVFGAGESINSVLSYFDAHKEARQNYYILCVDTSLRPLLQHNIIPDGVFIEEAQSVISKAFIGTIQQNLHIFAGLTSLPLISKIFPKENISFFTTLYANGTFIDNLNIMGILPCTNMPMGSVGLTAVYYSLKFRKNNTVPVYVCGLDFSYSVGPTHAKGALAHTQRLITTSRLQSVENYGAAFGPGTFSTKDKNGTKVISSQVLSGYAALFTSLFSSELNLFDAGTSGLNLGVPVRLIPDDNNLQKEVIPITEPKINKSTNSQKKDSISSFTKDEIIALKELRSLLTGETKLPTEQRNLKIKELAAPREYLYLHFPDGHQFSMAISFLKRVRTEIDYFLKVFEN